MRISATQQNVEENIFSDTFDNGWIEKAVKSEGKDW